MPFGVCHEAGIKRCNYASTIDRSADENQLLPSVAVCCASIAVGIFAVGMTTIKRSGQAQCVSSLAG